MGTCVIKVVWYLIAGRKYSYRIIVEVGCLLVHYLTPNLIMSELALVSDLVWSL